jgi:hypothetical protein
MLTTLSLAVALGLGVGAIDSNSITVLIDGKPTKIVIAGVAAGDARGAEFAQCLVAGRVLRITGPHSAARVTLLDDTSVSAHIGEFLQTKTSSDPCDLGKAAYQPKALHAAAAETAATPLPVVKKKSVHEVHVSYSSGESNKGGRNLPAPFPPPAQPYAQPAQAAPQPAGAGMSAQTYTPPTVGTYTPPAIGTSAVVTTSTQPVQQQGTEPLPQQPTENIPTTTASKPPL